MLILGILAFYHDSAAALVRDGEIAAAAQEERFSRRKHDARFPRHAFADKTDNFFLDMAHVNSVSNRILAEHLASLIFTETETSSKR